MIYGDKPISHLVEMCWLIEARCACGHFGRLDVPKLRELPQGALVADVCARLKCERCGAGDVDAMVLQDQAEASRRNPERG